MASFFLDELMTKDKGPLSSRPKEKKGGVKRRQPQPQSSNSDIKDLATIFQSMPTPRGYSKPMVRRGMSGAVLNADGSDPGNSFDQFLAKNPQYNRENRQATLEAENSKRLNDIFTQGQQAVQERKALQEMGLAPFQQQNPSGLPKEQSVKSSDGFLTVFDKNGKAVGTNRTLGKPQDAGMFGVSSTNPMNPNLGGMIQGQFDNPSEGENQYADLFAPQVKAPQTAQTTMPGSQGAKTPFSLDTLLPKTATGLPMDTPEAAGKASRERFFGSIFKQPRANSNELPAPQLSQAKLATPSPLPNNFSQDQFSTLTNLINPVTRQPRGRFDFAMTNLFPGDDYAYLNRLFPGQPVWTGENSIMQLLQNPAILQRLLEMLPPQPVIQTQGGYAGDSSAY